VYSCTSPARTRRPGLYHEVHAKSPKQSGAHISNEVFGSGRVLLPCCFDLLGYCQQNIYETASSSHSRASLPWEPSEHVHEKASARSGREEASPGERAEKSPESGLDTQQLEGQDGVDECTMLAPGEAVRGKTRDTASDERGTCPERPSACCTTRRKRMRVWRRPFPDPAAMAAKGRQGVEAVASGRAESPAATAAHTVVRTADVGPAAATADAAFEAAQRSRATAASSVEGAP